MRGGRSLEFLKFALADRLHKTLAEIDAMPVEEFNGWQAYERVRAEMRKDT